MGLSTTHLIIFLVIIIVIFGFYNYFDSFFTYFLGNFVDPSFEQRGGVRIVVRLVAALALTMFDLTKRIHGLGDRDDPPNLEVAAVALHDDLHRRSPPRQPLVWHMQQLLPWFQH